MPLHIAYGDPSALRARCEIATVRTARPGEAAYEPGAIIPAGQWRPMSEADVKAVTAPRRPLDSTIVEIVRPTFREGLPLEDLTGPLGDPDAVYLGQALAKPDMTTTTDNYEDGRLIGLHLDNWDKLPYADKHTGRRRICLNLGPGTRFIVLGTLDAQSVCRTIHPDGHAHRYPHTQDYRDYVASGRPLRVIRIRLAPGEGYVAPTEYLLHDGSTEAQDQPSAAAFWLGHWRRGILPSLI
ncbi:hypothetical protein [Streptomyces sp. WM6368]|uniref:hypothetical protein n=1 Tax=Streptomyces sp. WM6368 TaxID=1415554 RepID=UPI0006AF00C6|nr:hypothetical protein [Streptomyces sp. WM6368]KOU27938.1 hypothetical protein ADK51_12795 [Streptomyces sp. WM6368]